MVRQDIFGEQKPKAASVSNTNKRQNVKTGKVKLIPEPGAGRRATKTEIWQDPGFIGVTINYTFDFFIKIFLQIC